MSATPTGVVVKAIRPDGTAEDVTEGVKALYDLVINSMDWGSGFLTAEDATPVAVIARICGFKGVEDVECYVIDTQREEFALTAARKAEKEAGHRLAYWQNNEIMKQAREKFDAALTQHVSQHEGTNDAM